MEAGEYLRDLRIYRGYSDGSLGLERPITRAEFATTMVRIVGNDGVSQGNSVTPTFNDVKSTHWAYQDISIAATNQWVKGYADKTFRPQGNITYAEVITVLVRVLGYESQTTGQWPESHLKVASDLGITKHLTLSPNHVVNRGEVAILLKEALFIELK